MKVLTRHFLSLIGLVLFAAKASGQSATRGFGEVSNSNTTVQRQFALIVGVSDYQYITPLNYLFAI